MDWRVGYVGRVVVSVVSPSMRCLWVGRDSSGRWPNAVSVVEGVPF